MKQIIEIIENIKNIVKSNGGELIIAMQGVTFGVTLDTCSDVHDSNLVVTKLTTKKNGKLYANSNWGMVNLEDTIADNDDWYTLEDIVKDIVKDNANFDRENTKPKFKIGDKVRIICEHFVGFWDEDKLLTSIVDIKQDNENNTLYIVNFRDNVRMNFYENELVIANTLNELERKVKNVLNEIEEEIIKIVNNNGGLLITDIHYSGGNTLNTIVMTEDYINEEFDILAIKINEYGKLSILPFYEKCTRLSTFFEMDYDEDENQFDECLKEWLDIHKDWWVDLNGGDVNIGATLISMVENIETHVKK
jgi:hypothetical protein